MSTRLDSDDHVRGLQVAEDLVFERRTWAVERGAWYAMVAIVVLALAGVFGNGWLSRARAASADRRLTVDYPRFARNRAPGEIRIRIRASSGGRLVRLSLARDYLDHLNEAHWEPPPESVIAETGRLCYVFSVRNAGEELCLRIEFEMNAIGSVSSELRVDGPDARDPSRVTINHFVFP